MIKEACTSTWLSYYKAAHNSFDKGRLRDQLAFSRETPGKGGCLCVELDLVQGS